MELECPTNIVVKNLSNQESRSMRIEWQKHVLGKKYNIYRGRIPYGIFEKIAITENDYFIDENYDIIDGTDIYYRISTINDVGDESAQSGPISDKSTSKYMKTDEGTWTDDIQYIENLHTNKYIDDTSSYIGVNPLPLGEPRRWQMNKIKVHELYILQDRGELVYLLKRKRVNYSKPDEDDDRKIGTNDESEFYEPIIICAALASPGSTHTVTKHGAMLEKQSRSWTIMEPKIQDGDILVNRENERMEIQNVTAQRSWRGVITWQQFDIKILPITDNIYRHPSVARLDGKLLVPNEKFFKYDFFDLNNWGGYY